MDKEGWLSFVYFFIRGADNGATASKTCLFERKRLTGVLFFNLSPALIIFGGTVVLFTLQGMTGSQAMYFDLFQILGPAQAKWSELLVFCFNCLMALLMV
jgi:hypothetical protein